MAGGRRRDYLVGVVSRRSLLSQGLWLACGLGGAWLLKDRILWPSPKAGFTSAPGGSGWLPFNAPRFNSPTLKVTLAGVEVVALLDSGAQRSVVDAGLARRLGLQTALSLPVVAFGVGGGSQVGRGTTADITAGGLTLRAVKLAVLDLGPIADERGLSTPLVLGQDVLREVVAEIDFPGRRLRFVDPQTYQPPARARAIPARLDGSALIVPVQVNGKPVEPILDTGATLVLSVTDEIARTLGLQHDPAVRPGASVVLGGVMPTRVLRADTVAFGGEVFQDELIDVFQGQKIPGFPTAVLGVEALRRVVATLDLGRGRLHLADSDTAAPRRRFHPRRRGGSGHARSRA